jgi:hypothetical protein
LELCLYPVYKRLLFTDLEQTKGRRYKNSFLMRRWLVHIFWVRNLNTGKESVGPNYDVTDKFEYDRAATHKIGTGLRRDKETEAKYDHYHRQDQDFDPIEADHMRKPRSVCTRIGLESRFLNNPKSLRGTPGP